MTTQVTNPVDPSTVKKTQDPAPPSAGMWLAFSAAILVLLTIQKYASEGLAPLIEKNSERNLKLGDAWLKIMNDPNNSGSDLQHIEWILKHVSTTDGEQSGAINAATAKLNIHNTLYSQSQSFWGGITQAGQQTISDENEITALVLKMAEQGPISQFANLFPRG